METFVENCEKALKTNIVECFKTAMLNFAKLISDKHSIELDEVLSVWNESNEEMFQLTKQETKKASKSKSKAKDGEICQATVVKTGKPCTLKVSAESTTGKYCGRHLKNESEDDGEKKSKTTKTKAKAKTKSKAKSKAKSKVKEDDNENDGDNEDNEEEEEKEPKLVVKKDSFGRYIDNETGFVFNTEKQVIGKGLDDGTVEDLSNDDLKFCKRYNLLVKQKDKNDKKDQKKKDDKKEVKSKENNDEEEENEDD